MPKRWLQILEIMERLISDYCENYHSLQLNPLAQLVELVPKSENEVMEVVRRSFNNPNPKITQTLAMSCSTFINGLPNNSLEITRMLWSLCDYDIEEVCQEAVFQVLHIIQSNGENTDIMVNALLEWSENDTHSSRSSLVRIVAIAHKFIDIPLEGVGHILSNLSEGDLGRLCMNAALVLQYFTGTKAEKEMATHRLFIMCLIRLFQSEINESEQFTMFVIYSEDPNELAMESAKLLINVEDSEFLAFMPKFLLKLAINCPEYEKDLLHKIYKLTEDEDCLTTVYACIAATSVLDKKPQDAEKIMRRCLQLIHDEDFANLFHVNDIVFLDVLLKTYVECSSDFLAFHITSELLYTPVTLEARENGSPQLIMQTASTSKVTYTFRTDKEAKEFISLVVCTEVMFPGLASFVPKLDVSEAQQSKRSFFETLGDNGGLY